MRKNDPSDLEKKFFRSDDRFFQVNGQWYFSAREGEIGPFRSREQALREAEAYATARASDVHFGRKKIAEPTVIPGYVYRSVLSMSEQVNASDHSILNIEDDE